MHHQLQSNGPALHWAVRLKHLDLHKQAAWVTGVLTAGSLQGGMNCLCCQGCVVRAMPCKLLQDDCTEAP